MLLFAVIVHGGCGGGRSVDESEPDGGLPNQQVLGSVVTGTQLLKGKLDLFGITTDDVAAVLDSTAARWRSQSPVDLRSQSIRRPTWWRSPAR